jgi:dephospho-CoA kinase
MIKVGLTGGIGSGKSLVAEIFQHLGVPVFHADVEAKDQYSNPEVFQKIIGIFGDSVVGADGLLDRKALASIVFRDTVMLGKLNLLIHPLVEAGFRNWLKQNEFAPYTVHEAAILFESGFDRLFDKIIVVDAPKTVCIERVMARDKVTAEQVEERMKNQWEPGLKASKADFIIQNDGKQLLLPQVIALHKTLLGLSSRL